jgi:hypothetical protein
MLKIQANAVARKQIKYANSPMETLLTCATALSSAELAEASCEALRTN